MRGILGLPYDVAVTTRDLADPLIYYGAGGVDLARMQEAAEDLSLLQGSVRNYLYDPHILQRLTQVGFVLPRNADLQMEPMETSLIGESIALIQQAWPAAFAELSQFMSGIVMIASDELRSMTGPTWFGAIFLGSQALRRADAVDITVSLVHEVGHMVLCAQSALESPMHDIGEKIFSPLVKRERPALMAFHAQIAMARMLLWLVNLKAYWVAGGEGSSLLPKVEPGLKEYTQCFTRGMEELRKLSLSESGKLLMADFEAMDRIMRAGAL
jgi:hypothetical protein